MLEYRNDGGRKKNAEFQISTITDVRQTRPFFHHSSIPLFQASGRSSNLKRGRMGGALLQPDTKPAPCGLGSHSGFTLLEVLVTVAILAIAMVAILKANVQNLDALTRARGATTASVLAANKLAEVEAAGAGRWFESQGDFGENYPGYTWEVETTSTELDGLIRVSVTVQQGEGTSGGGVSIEELMLAE